MELYAFGWRINDCSLESNWLENIGIASRSRLEVRINREIHLHLKTIEIVKISRSDIVDNVHNLTRKFLSHYFLHFWEISSREDIDTKVHIGNVTTEELLDFVKPFGKVSDGIFFPSRTSLMIIEWIFRYLSVQKSDLRPIYSHWWYEKVDPQSTNTIDIERKSIWLEEQYSKQRVRNNSSMNLDVLPARDTRPTSRKSSSTDWPSKRWFKICFVYAERIILMLSLEDDNEWPYQSNSGL